MQSTGCLSALQVLRSPHIVEFLGLVVDARSGAPLLMTELAPLGSLDRLLRRYQECSPKASFGPELLGAPLDELPWARRLSLGVQLARGVRHLHKHAIIHRDLKPQNCLLFTAGGDASGPAPLRTLPASDISGSHPVLKICDFGLSRLLAPLARRKQRSPSAGSSPEGSPRATPQMGGDGSCLCSWSFSGEDSSREVSRDPSRHDSTSQLPHLEGQRRVARRVGGTSAPAAPSSPRHVTSSSHVAPSHVAPTTDCTSTWSLQSSGDLPSSSGLPSSRRPSRCPSHDLSSRDISSHDLSSRDLSSRDLSSYDDLSSRDLSSRDLAIVVPLPSALEPGAGRGAQTSVNESSRPTPEPPSPLRQPLLQTPSRLPPPLLAAPSPFSVRSSVTANLGTPDWSHVTPSHMTANLGTPHWMAPEVMQIPGESRDSNDFGRAEYTLAADVYSVGLLLWAVGTTSFPFDELHRTADIFRAVRAGARPPLPDEPAMQAVSSGGLLPAWFGLVTHCWLHEAEERPTMEQVCAALESIHLEAGRVVAVSVAAEPGHDGLHPLSPNGLVPAAASGVPDGTATSSTW